MSFTYGNSVLVLPKDLLLHVDRASKKDLRVLLALAAEPLAMVDLDAACKKVAAALLMGEREVENALAFWRGTGLFTLEEGGETAPLSVATAARPVVVSDGGLPSYSSQELTGVLERRSDLSLLIDECQRVFGKIFNTKEISTVVGLIDYLGLTGEYILLLMAHCIRMEKRSMRYLEKMALSLHDEGILDVNALEERLNRAEMMASAEGRIRAMFGLSSRALTTKERRMVEKWICVMQYDDEVIRMAYEITVDAIGKPSLPYANTILERWFAEGYRTAEDVQRAIADYQRKKKTGGSSFDVDDFFEAALKRTYGE